jgi:hypothetical protein
MSGEEDTPDVNLLLQIGYSATKKERDYVSGYLLNHLLSGTGLKMRYADVYTGDLLNSHPPKPLHHLTDVMGLDRFVMTVILKNKKRTEVRTLVSRIKELAFEVR